MGYPIDSATYYALWSGPHRNSAHDVFVSFGLDCDSLLYEPEKEFAPVAGRSTIEAKRELIEVVVQMLTTNGTLMRAQQPTLQ